MKTKRLRHFDVYFRTQNPEAREKRKFLPLCLLLCAVWTVAILFILKQEHEAARELDRVLSPSEAVKTSPGASSAHYGGNIESTEPLVFTF